MFGMQNYCKDISGKSKQHKNELNAFETINYLLKIIPTIKILLCAIGMVIHS